MDPRAGEIIGSRMNDKAVGALPLHPDIVTLMARLPGYSQPSGFAEEEEAVARAVPKRRREFYAGRNLARLALQQLHVPACALPRNEDRSPCWPRGVRGSISHTDEVVMVAVSTAAGLHGIGVDVEVAGSVESDLRTMIRAADCEAALDDTLLFSAKEAVFKAVYPICGEFLEFADVVIAQSDERGGFQAYGRPGLRSSTSVRHGSGRFMRVGDAVVTAFWIYTR